VAASGTGSDTRPAAAAASTAVDVTAADTADIAGPKPNRPKAYILVLPRL
jgi:hypothetical protein